MVARRSLLVSDRKADCGRAGLCELRRAQGPSKRGSEGRREAQKSGPMTGSQVPLDRSLGQSRVRAALQSPEHGLHAPDPNPSLRTTTFFII